MDLIEQIKNNYVDLQKIVDDQYQKWLNHVSIQRVEKRQIHNELFKKPKVKWAIASRTLWRYMKLWMAINVLDWTLVEFTPLWKNIISEFASNVNKVYNYDYKAMSMFDIDWQVKWNVWLYWLWCKAFVGWDSIDKHPVVQSVDPLSIIPDPQYQHAKDMRFIWFEQRANIYDLTEDRWFFWVDEIIRRKWEVSIELDETRSSLLNANSYPVEISDDWMIDIYYHYISYKWKKFLTVWVWDRKILIKIVELKPKTKAEKLDNRKITFPVEFYRSNPIANLFFWASFWDEIWQYANAETVLDNLELILARKIAMWEDKFVDTSILDIKTLKNKTPWWRYIPIKLEDNRDIRASIFSIPQDNPWQLPQYVWQKMWRKIEETTAISDVAFGVSPNWNQTKAEIQTLQQNLNTILAYSVTMLMRSEKRCAEIWYSYYVYNLPANSKKFIAVTKWSWPSDIFEFKKKDFAIDCPVLIEVKSKAQEKQRKEKKFARFQVIMWTILPNTQPWSYAYNAIMREYLTLWDLERDEVTKFLPYSVDEIDAMEWLTLLENWEKPASPKEWQDYDIFINYYSYARDDEKWYKQQIIREYIEAKKVQEQLKKQQALMWWMEQMMWWEEWWKTDNIAQAQMWNSLIQQDSNKMPSVQDLQA